MKIMSKVSTMKKAVVATLSLAALAAALAPGMASAEEPNPNPPPSCTKCDWTGCAPGPVRCIPHCYPIPCP